MMLLFEKRTGEAHAAQVAALFENAVVKAEEKTSGNLIHRLVQNDVIMTSSSLSDLFSRPISMPTRRVTKNPPPPTLSTNQIA